MKKEARNFLDSIEFRRQTLLIVTESIVRHQREFFENGPSGLKPLIQDTIADDIGMDQSSVSRVVTSKYVST